MPRTSTAPSRTAVEITGHLKDAAHARRHLLLELSTLDNETLVLIHAARDAGMSWERIGTALGSSGGAVWARVQKARKG